MKNKYNISSTPSPVFPEAVKASDVSIPITSSICFFTLSTSDAGKSILFKTVIGLPNFAENMVIPAKDTRLSYDPNNQYDLKKVNQATVAANTSSTAVASDLPF